MGYEQTINFENKDILKDFMAILKFFIKNNNVGIQLACNFSEVGTFEKQPIGLVQDAELLFTDTGKPAAIILKVH